MQIRFKKSLLGLALGLVALVFVIGPAQAGSLEPSAPPGPTTQIPPAWSQILPDADRFEVVMAGAGVLDKETGLVWEQSALTTFGNWTFARQECTSRNVGGRKGWRLPSVHELASLLDTSVPFPPGPMLPSGHPFSIGQPSFDFWSATTDADDPTKAWGLSFGVEVVTTFDKPTTTVRVWCVRGNMNADAY